MFQNIFEEKERLRVFPHFDIHESRCKVKDAWAHVIITRNTMVRHGITDMYDVHNGEQNWKHPLTDWMFLITANYFTSWLTRLDKLILQKKIALAMALHSRLGENSPLSHEVFTHLMPQITSSIWYSKKPELVEPENAIFIITPGQFLSLQRRDNDT
jgi:hypothetical protein